MTAFMTKISAFLLAVYTMLMGVLYPKMESFRPEPLEVPTTASGEGAVFFAGEGEASAAHYEVVIADMAPATDESAAAALVHYISEVCSEELPIVRASQARSQRAVLIGEAAGKQTELAGLKNESYIIRRENDNIIIAGKGERGTIYGVYEFLRAFANVRFFTKELISAPRQSVIMLPAELDEVYEPYFELRETEWISGKDAAYSVANQLNSNVYRSIEAEKGGTAGYIGSFCHTLTNNILNKDVYFAAHPEYYAYRKSSGKREPTQLCLTNPDVLRLVCDEVLEMLRQNYNPDSESVQIISLTQDDNYQYCECEDCAAVDAAGGSQAATMLHFVNAVADVVKQAGYDNCAIDTFAYQYTRKVPTGVVPRDNVIVRLCSIECCFSHPLDEKGCVQNEQFMADLKGWAEICDRLHIWDYTTNYAHFMGIFPNFGVMARNAQIFAENNVTGIYEEGNYKLHTCDTEFGELRCYILSRLMWNPYIDYDKEINSFLNAYYGEQSAPYIRRFIDMTTEKTGRHGSMMDYDGRIRKNLCSSIYAPMTSKAVLDLEHNEVAYCDELWQGAIEAAEDNSYLDRIVRSQLSWRYWKACNKQGEFSRIQLPTVWRAENERLYNDMKSHGVVSFSEVYPLTDSPNFSKTPDTWK